MQVKDIIKTLLFRFKYRKNISRTIVIYGHDDIYIGKQTMIRNFAAMYAHKGSAKGKIYFGNNCIFGECLYVLAGSGVVKIANNLLAGSKLSLLGGGNISIGNNVLISHNVLISSSSHDFTHLNTVATETASTFGSVSISNNVFIGANVSILMGCSIAEGAIIGAGSVVTENTIIGKNEIWYGNPAKLQCNRMSLKEQIEKDMFEYVEKYPFHNLFLLYMQNKSIPKLGGTCSDRTKHFKEILENKYRNLDVKLHIASINNKDTHTILRIIIDKEIYFCDVGMGFPITKLLACHKEIKFISHGISFRTVMNDTNIKVFIDEQDKDGEKEIMTINSTPQSQEYTKRNIDNRMAYIKDLALGKKLRYFFIDNGKFYKIEG